MTFKSFTANEYSITPFVTHKNQSYTFVSGSSTNPQEISFDVAVAPPSQNWSFFPNLELQNADGIYQHTLYNSVLNEFYSSASTLPYSISQSVASMNFGAGGSHFRNFVPSSSFYVLNIAQSAFGEGIRPSSFNITNTSSSFSIIDDGQGRLVISSSNSSSAVVGNIFYNLGIATLSIFTSSLLYFLPFSDISNSGIGPSPLFNNLMNGSFTTYDKFVSSSFSTTQSSCIVRMKSQDTSKFITQYSPVSQSLLFSINTNISNLPQSLVFFTVAIFNEANSGSAMFGNPQVFTVPTPANSNNKWNNYELFFNTPSNATSSYQSSVDLVLSLQGNGATGSIELTNLAWKVTLPTGSTTAFPYQESIFDSGIAINSASATNVSFDATQTIYTHQAICSVEPTEFTFSSNPSCFVTNSLGQKIPDLFLSGNLLPYVTTVGLYDSDYELIAVAKVPNPIKRLTETEQSFIIRLDA